jgi:hypothetical protein
MKNKETMMKRIGMYGVIGMSLLVGLTGCNTAALSRAAAAPAMAALGGSGAAAGAAAALPAALPGLTNPAAMGVMGATAVMDARQSQKNLEAFDKLQALSNPEAMKR